MKRIIATITAAALMIGMAAGAAASDRVKGIQNTIAEKDEIHILYNDKMVEYEDVKPVNTDGRVMIPFRAALENMGATVDYDDSQRLVTAKKGDTTISFTLMDDTIYIDKNGAQSNITMDVPMIIVEDRTLVPIRFMSNAFGMQVGWEGNSETVMIMDYDDYLDDLDDIAPNISRLANTQTTANKGVSEFDISLKTSENGAGTELAASGTASTVKSGGVQGEEINLTLKTPKLSIDKADMSAVVSDGKMYIKSDFIKNLAAASDNETVKGLSVLVPENGWCSVDIAQLATGMGMPDSVAALIKTVIGFGTEDISDIMLSDISKEGEAVFSDSISLAAQMDLYEELDKYITYSEADGGYSVSVDISPQIFNQLIDKVLGTVLTEEEKSALGENLSCSLKASVSGDGSKENANVDASIGLNMNGRQLDLKIKINKSSETAAAETVTVPENSFDATQLLTLLF